MGDRQNAGLFLKIEECITSASQSADINIGFTDYT